MHADELDCRASFIFTSAGKASLQSEIKPYCNRDKKTKLWMHTAAVHQYWWGDDKPWAQVASTHTHAKRKEGATAKTITPTPEGSMLTSFNQNLR